MNFAPSRFGAHVGDDCYFVQHDRRVLNERGVRMVRVGVERNDPGAEVAQRVAIGAVLPERRLEVDPRAFEKGKFAVPNARRRGMSDRDEHGQIHAPPYR